MHTSIHACLPAYLPRYLKKKKKLYGSFLWIGFNCLKATATSRRQFTFYNYWLTTDWLTDQRTNEPTDQSTDGLTDTLTDWQTNWPTNQPTYQSTDQPTNWPTDRPTFLPTKNKIKHQDSGDTNGGLNPTTGKILKQLRFVTGCKGMRSLYASIIRGKNDLPIGRIKFQKLNKHNN